MLPYKKKLIEVALPLEDINLEAAREKSIRHGHPSTLHLWWARRPLAACRAVLFAQLVDDPEQEGLNSEYLQLIDEFNTDHFYFPKERDIEFRKYLYPSGFVAGQTLGEWRRERLFAVIQQLVQWENIQNEPLLQLANRLITTSCNGEPPAVYDPFSGGGSIPLEAQRLGLAAYGSDLNPVAVMIGKALIEIPPKFAGMPPVNPESRERAEQEQQQGQQKLGKKDKQKELFDKRWKGAQGLAEDVRYYGQWMRDRAFEKIGHLYPEVMLPSGEKATVIAWLWARTVASPNPALSGVQVPLAASFLLSSKAGKEAWVEPVLAEDGRSYHFEVRTEPVPEERRSQIKTGTKASRGANFTCLLSGVPIVGNHIKAEGVAGRMGARLMAIVAEGKKGRIYLSPTLEMEEVANTAKPDFQPEQEMPKNPRWFSPPDYGMRSYSDIFTNRQLVALNTFSDLVLEAREKAFEDAIASKLNNDGERLRDGGCNADAYSDAIATYLGLGVSRLSDICNSLCMWENTKTQVRHLFTRHAIPMLWDFAEPNIFSGAAGDYQTTLNTMIRVINTLPIKGFGKVQRLDCAKLSNVEEHSIIFSTDPPYYDNIGYSDLSDFFYTWMRRSLKSVHPHEFSTLISPKDSKDSELVANPYRHGGKQKAEEFFMKGMTQAMRNIQQQSAEYPITIYYAFKQSEAKDAGVSSTGWETFLEAVNQAGLSINGTWPLRTELSNRMIASGTNALASSIVLVCRKQLPTAKVTTRGDFLKALKRELPTALKTLQHSNIAPVDMAQASIGPGMAIFTRYSKVMEADGKPMSVRTALQLINKALDEYFSEQEGEYDAETRFAITWFEQFGMNPSDNGTAEVLATARNISVEGVKQAGIFYATAGKARLLRREELPPDWNPLLDNRLCVWEATQHLIRAYQTTGGETAPAELLDRLNRKDSSIAEAARDLAYRLYSICDRKKWTEEALAYNSLVTVWSDIVARAVEIHKEQPKQGELFS